MRRFWKELNLLYERLLLAVLSVVFLVMLWWVYDNYYIYSHTLGKDILRYKPGNTVSVSAEDEPISEDMVAWITIDNTTIDYPVMQGTDNIVYLNTDPFGHYSLSGSIFLDSRCSSDFSDPYSLIYGHHMEYKRMFGALDDFLDGAYLAQHSSGTLMLGRDAGTVCRLRIFASLRANPRESTLFDPGDEDVSDYIRLHASAYTEDPDGRIIALSTCAQDDMDMRIVVFAYMIE